MLRSDQIVLYDGSLEPVLTLPLEENMVGEPRFFLGAMDDFCFAVSSPVFLKVFQVHTSSDPQLIGLIPPMSLAYPLA